MRRLTCVVALGVLGIGGVGGCSRTPRVPESPVDSPTAAPLTDPSPSVQPAKSACHSSGGVICLDLVGRFGHGTSGFEVAFRERADTLWCTGGVSRTAGLAAFGASGPPEPGTYRLGIHNSVFAAAFHFTYHVRGIHPDSLRGYVSVDGELRVITSTPERFDGSFFFTAARYLQTPQRVEPDLPKIRVKGVFAATPRPAVLIMDRRQSPPRKCGSAP